jgi:hypothetical protein
MEDAGRKRSKHTDVDAFYIYGEGMTIMNRNPRTYKLGDVIDDERFIQYFGTSPLVIATIWNLLEPYDTMDDCSPQLKHLLWAFILMKRETQNSSMAGGVDEKTFRLWAWRFVNEISNLEPEVVRFFALLQTDKECHLTFYYFYRLIGSEERSRIYGMIVLLLLMVQTFQSVCVSIRTSFHTNLRGWGLDMSLVLVFEQGS